MGKSHLGNAEGVSRSSVIRPVRVATRRAGATLLGLVSALALMSCSKQEEDPDWVNTLTDRGFSVRTVGESPTLYYIVDCGTTTVATIIYHTDTGEFSEQVITSGETGGMTGEMAPLTKETILADFQQCVAQ